MTPEQKFLTKILFIVLVLVGVFFGGFGVRGYMAKAERTVWELDKQTAANATLNQYAQDLLALANTNQALRNQVHRLDITHTGKLNEELAENRQLRADLDVARRMHLKGTSCPKAPASGDVAGSPGVGDGTAVVLGGETRLAVWDLREALIVDRRKLAFLQDERRKLKCEVQKTPG